MLIRREAPTDHDLVGEVHRRAFGSLPDYEPIEHELLTELRNDPGWVPALSMVAEDDSGTVVGHIVATEGSLDGGRPVGIGPVGVLPELHGSGIGSALVHAVVAGADALDYTLACLLGAPAYYSRFGFVPASSLGVEAPDPAWGVHFQARALTGHGGTPGTFRYAAPFEAL